MVFLAVSVVRVARAALESLGIPLETLAMLRSGALVTITPAGLEMAKSWAIRGMVRGGMVDRSARLSSEDVVRAMRDDWP